MTAWSLDQARKTYSIPHWSEGYFDVDAAGRISVRPRGDERPGDRIARSRRCRARQRCAAAVAGALPGHPRRSPGKAAGRVRAGAGRLGLPRRLHRGVSDQGQPAARRRRHAGLARRRRLRPGGRQQARADGGAGAVAPGRADRLQRLQGPRIHPPGADRSQARAGNLHRDREAVGAAAGARGSARARRATGHRRAHAAGVAGRGQVAEQRRRQGQVRAVAAAVAGPVEAAARRRHGRLRSACCISTWARRSPTCATSPTACARRCATWSSCRSSARRCATWTSAAAWASTTRARARAATARSTTASRQYASNIVQPLAEACEAARPAAAAHRHRMRPRDDRAPRGAGGQRVRSRGSAGRPRAAARTTTSRR